MKQIISLIFAVFLLVSCYATHTAGQPKLVVFLVIDQLPAELFQRIEDEFTGGFKWLLDHGVDYRNAHHEHGNTLTGTGHFVLGSGRYPGEVGVLGNSWYSRELEKTVYCVEDSLAKPVGGRGEARSYRQTHSTAMGDWMKKKNPKSKVFSVAGKDRSAVFLGGKNANLAVYYDWKGSFMTSDYYAKSLPKWLVDFNENLDFTTYRDSIWNHIGYEEFYNKYGTADNYMGEKDYFNSDPYSPVLPINFNNLSDEKINNNIGSTPWLDRTVLELAQSVIKNENLGDDVDCDYIGIGLSAADWIGHNFGPHSHEILDYYLRVDFYLETFIHFLDMEVGLENAVIILSSDHGTMPLPEYLQSQGVDAGRVNFNLFKNKLATIYEKTDNEIMYEAGGFYFPNDFSVKKRNHAMEIIKKELTGLKAIDGLLKKEDIMKFTGNDSFSNRMRNMIHPEKSPDIIIMLKENYCYKNTYGTNHGTPYNYDTHVPIIFSHLNYKKQSIQRSVATVDIAPTVAKIVGVSFPDAVDGIVLNEVIR